MGHRKLPLAYNPTTKQSDRRHLYQLNDDYSRHLSFGSDENNDGVPEAFNMLGAWVKTTATDPGAAITFTHSMAVQTTSPSAPNVAWEIVCFKHSGVGAPAVGVHGGALSLVYEGGAVTPNSIVLVLRTSGVRTISVAEPVTMLVFFAPVGNW